LSPVIQVIPEIFNLALGNSLLVEIKSLRYYSLDRPLEYSKLSISAFKM